MEIKNYFAQDAQGNIMPSANCYLYLPGTTTLAAGLVDGNGTPISNPFLASGMGQITFGAPNGVYDLRVALGARDWTIKVQCADIVQAMDVMDSILGSHAENPTTRNNGQPLEPGDETWNSTDKQPYWWSGTAWVALNSSAQQLEERLAAPTGATKSGFRGATVNDVLEGSAPFGPSTQRIDQVSSSIQAGPFISRPWSTVGPLNIFVDPVIGNDANTGVNGSPLKTIDAAMQKVPQNIYHRVRIFLLDGDYSGQLIRAFNYYVSPRSSSTAGFKIIGHVAVVDGQAHPIYTDDARQNVIIGGGIISSVRGTEEFTIAGLTVKDGWIQAYDCYVEMYRCHYQGGVGVDKIPVGGHYSTVKNLECTFDDVCCAIDAEGFVMAAFDGCAITNIVEHPTQAVYGRPIVARNFSKVYIKNSPTFYNAGPTGKRNTATNQSEMTGAPYSHAAEDGFAIYRGWDASQLLLSGGTGRDLNNVRGGGLALFGSA
ncbi:MAG: DUF1565 domain-containing protein, partial [Pseudomonas sp.]|nr:DUF1565 domain-containing protein [Pseudomonas sp.]